MKIFRTSALGSALLLVAACGGGSGGAASVTGTPTDDGPATLTVEATDAPFDHALVEVARLAVDRIEIHSAAEADDGFTTLYEGPPISVDLMQLQNGIKRTLVRTELAPGTYRQVRLRLADAYVRLRNGREYSTVAGNLGLTSAATSGLKVFVDPPVTVQRGLDRGLLLDFDLTQTFRPIPANDPLTATRFLVGPVVRAVAVAETGTLRGRVTRIDPTEGSVGVDGGTVHVLPPGETDLDRAVGTTGTTADGDFALLGLPPGVYDVTVTHEGQQGGVVGQRVDAGATTTVEVAVE